LGYNKLNLALIKIMTKKEYYNHCRHNNIEQLQQVLDTNPSWLWNKDFSKTCFERGVHLALDYKNMDTLSLLLDTPMPLEASKRVLGDIVEQYSRLDSASATLTDFHKNLDEVCRLILQHIPNDQFESSLSGLHKRALDHARWGGGHFIERLNRNWTEIQAHRLAEKMRNELEGSNTVVSRRKL